jgi:hypothetical protein
MGTIRRRKHNQHSGRITRDAVACFMAGDWRGLHAALRLPPWQVSPLDATGPCPWPAGTRGGDTWPDSVALREALHGHH